MIYLDNAATTLRKPPCVIDAVVQAMQTMGNSGRSAHAESLAAARTIFAAREALAALFGCPQPDHVCLHRQFDRGAEHRHLRPACAGRSRAVDGSGA